MKKIFEKMRTKIIHKLGGYAVNPESRPDLMAIHTFQKKYVTLEASYFVDAALPQWDTEIEGFVRTELAYQLANKMLEEDLIQFWEYPIDIGRTKLKARITIEDRRLNIE